MQECGPPCRQKRGLPPAPAMASRHGVILLSGAPASAATMEPRPYDRPGHHWPGTSRAHGDVCRARGWTQPVMCRGVASAPAPDQTQLYDCQQGGQLSFAGLCTGLLTEWVLRSARSSLRAVWIGWIRCVACIAPVNGALSPSFWAISTRVKSKRRDPSPCLPATALRLLYRPQTKGETYRDVLLVAVQAGAGALKRRGHGERLTLSTCTSINSVPQSCSL